MDVFTKVQPRVIAYLYNGSEDGPLAFRKDLPGVSMTLQEGLIKGANILVLETPDGRVINAYKDDYIYAEIDLDENFNEKITKVGVLHKDKFLKYFKRLY